MFETGRYTLQKIQEQYKHDYSFSLAKVAELAKLDLAVVQAMFKNEPVYKDQAVKALKAVSKIVGWHWTLDNVIVTIKPDKITFSQLRSLHHFNIREVAIGIVGNGGVTVRAVRKGAPAPDKQKVREWELIIYQMLVGEPIKSKDAKRVLKVLPELISTAYTLDDLDIKLLPDEPQP